MASPPSKLASINGDSLLKEQMSAIKALLNAAGRQKTFRTYQLLPRHRRRRIMSWSVRCLPRVFKALTKHDSLAPPPKPSRKARRRRSLSRLRIFFAKRFAIRIRSGVRMPVHANQKQLRYTERTLLSGAVCYCNLQQRYAIVHIHLDSSGTISSSTVTELKRLQDQNSAGLLLLEGIVPALLSYIDTDEKGTNESRYLLSYNMVDEGLIRRWFPLLQSLPNLVHMTILARQRNFKPGICYDIDDGTKRICNAISRRIWGSTEYSGLRAARDLTPESRRLSCYPNCSTAPCTDDTRPFSSNYFITDLATNNLTNSMILRAFKISKLALAPLGEPPEWKRGSRNALRYKVQNASLELFDDQTLLQLTKEMEIYLSNDSLRKLRVMQALSSDTRKDPMSLMNQRQIPVDEGEVVNDDNDCIPSHHNASSVALASNSQLVEASAPTCRSRHIDVLPLASLSLDVPPSDNPILSLQSSIIFHPILSTSQFVSLSFAVQDDEAQPLLLGLVRDGVPISGEQELLVTMSNLALAPFIPTTLAPSVLYYNLSAVLDAFGTWVRLPRNKRAHSYPSRSMLWYISRLSDSAELTADYLTSPIAICFDLVLEEVCRELHNQCHLLRRAAIKQAKDAFLQWVTTPAHKLNQSGFDLRTKDAKDKIDLSATIARLNDFVESLPLRSFELEPLLRLATRYTKILSLTSLHKYPYGHILKVQPANSVFTEQLSAVVLHCSYSTLMGRCLAILLIVFTTQQLVQRDAICTNPPNEFHIEGEQFTSRLHWV